jgi:hypothetical protein
MIVYCSVGKLMKNMHLRKRSNGSIKLKTWEIENNCRNTMGKKEETKKKFPTSNKVLKGNLGKISNGRS